MALGVPPGAFFVLGRRTEWSCLAPIRTHVAGLVAGTLEPSNTSSDASSPGSSAALVGRGGMGSTLGNGRRFRRFRRCRREGCGHSCRVSAWSLTTKRSAMAESLRAERRRRGCCGMPA